MRPRDGAETCCAEPWPFIRSFKAGAAAGAARDWPVLTVTLLEDDDRQVLASLGGRLLEADGGAQAVRAAPENDGVGANGTRAPR